MWHLLGSEWRRVFKDQKSKRVEKSLCSVYWTITLRVEPIRGYICPLWRMGLCVSQQPLCSFCPVSPQPISLQFYALLTRGQSRGQAEMEIILTTGERSVTCQSNNDVALEGLSNSQVSVTLFNSVQLCCPWLCATGSQSEPGLLEPPSIIHYLTYVSSLIVVDNNAWQWLFGYCYDFLKGDVFFPFCDMK